jgi:hypothetical protein
MITTPRSTPSCWRDALPCNQQVQHGMFLNVVHCLFMSHHCEIITVTLQHQQDDQTRLFIGVASSALTIQGLTKQCLTCNILSCIRRPDFAAGLASCTSVTYMPCKHKTFIRAWAYTGNHQNPVIHYTKTRQFHYFLKAFKRMVLPRHCRISSEGYW